MSLGILFATVGTTATVDAAGAAPLGSATLTVVSALHADAVVSDSTGNLFLGGSGTITELSPSGVATVVAGGSCSGGGGGDQRPHGRVARVASSGGRRPVTPADQTCLGKIGGMAFDSQGNLYFSDSRYSRVYEMGPGGSISVVAGDGSYGTVVEGPASSSPLGTPMGLAFDAVGNLYVADRNEAVVYKVTVDGTLSLFAGQIGFYGPITPGPALATTLVGPRGVALDAEGNVYIADEYGQCIERVATDGTLSIVAGSSTEQTGTPTPGPAVDSLFDHPTAVTVDASGNLVIVDSNNNLIEQVAPDGTLSIVAGDGTFNAPTPGPALQSALPSAVGEAFDATGNLFVTGYGVVKLGAAGPQAEPPSLRKVRAARRLGSLWADWSRPSSKLGRIDHYTATARDGAGNVAGSCTNGASHRNCRIDGLASGTSYSVTVSVTERAGVAGSVTSGESAAITQTTR